jgi:glycosyltransferase involved in cell wall biosynthesis
MTERVAFFIPALERGGVERNVVNLAHGFIHRGVEVDVVLSRGHPAILPQLPSEARLVWTGRSWAVRLATLPIRLLSARVRTSVSAFWGLVCYLRIQRPDVLVSFQAHPFALLARRVAHVPTKVIIREAATPSASAATQTGLASRLAPRLKRWMYPWADALVANSHGAAQDMESMLRRSHGPMRVVYNPTVTDGLTSQGKEPLGHPWFAPGQPPVVVGVGRLTLQKDFETLVRAFDLVHKQMSARLILLGEGEERPHLETLVERLGLGGDVELPGFITNPYPYMARAAVFVLSSRWEGLPNALIEALALGTPVVATDCPSGPREVLMEGGAGLLVPVGGVQAMVVAILRVLQDPQLGQELVRVGQQHLDRFRPEAGVEQWLEIIRETIGAAP